MIFRQALALVAAASRFATGAAFFILMGAVLVQVLGRTLFHSSPVWTEELTRFALLYVAAIGLGLAYRSGDLVNVDLVCESLPAPWPKLLRALSALLTAMLCLILIGPAWRFTSIGALQTSPALTWRMDFIHASMLVALVSLCIFSLARFLSIATGESDGLPQAAGEETP